MCTWNFPPQPFHQQEKSISGCEAFLGTAQQPALPFPAQKQILRGLSFLFCTPAPCSSALGPSLPCQDLGPAPAGSARTGHRDSRGWWQQPRDHTGQKPLIHIALLSKPPPQPVMSTLSALHLSPPGKVRGVSESFFCCCLLFQSILSIRDRHRLRVAAPGASQSIPRGGSPTEQLRRALLSLEGSAGWASRALQDGFGRIPQDEFGRIPQDGFVRIPQDGFLRAHHDGFPSPGWVSEVSPGRVSLPRLGFPGLPGWVSEGSEPSSLGSAGLGLGGCPGAQGSFCLAEAQPGHLWAQPGPS